jgi:hypothetical protein
MNEKYARMLVNHPKSTFVYSLNIHTCKNPCQLANLRSILVETRNSQIHNHPNQSIMVDLPKTGGSEFGTFFCPSVCRMM